MKQVNIILASMFLLLLCSCGVKENNNSEELRKLQQEINYLKDSQAIRNLVNNLQNPVDASDASGFKNNFADDGIFELIEERNGKPNTIAYLNTSKMEDFMNGRFKVFKQQGEQRRHLLTSIYIVNQDMNQAEVKITALLLTTVKHKTINLVSPLAYSVKVVKNRDGEWKFKHVTGYLDTSLD